VGFKDVLRRREDVCDEVFALNDSPVNRSVDLDLAQTAHREIAKNEEADQEDGDQKTELYGDFQIIQYVHGSFSPRLSS
jgi:hypothetical protein